MEFEDEEINKLDLSNSPNDMYRLIVSYFCGKSYDPEKVKENENLLLTLIETIKKEGLNYSQLNEILLLLNQDIIGKDFFNFFFGSGMLKLDDLKRGIVKFRGFAMLRFGNFRIACRELAYKNEDELKSILKPYCDDPSELQREFEKRPTRMFETESIPRERLWYLGGISGEKVASEIEALAEEIRKFEEGRSNFKKTPLRKIRSELIKVDKQVELAQRSALANTDIFLTWDYMDIYVATSMRNKWEYEDTFDFLKTVFQNARLKKLKTRHFDPTQSICSNPRDKGLLEGLMLKRVKCAIYLAQESDTMGKDSELAATLAQGKPVIAYVPEHDPQKYSQKIAQYPLNFFERRLKILDAEETFDEAECYEKLKKIDENYQRTIKRFLTELEEYRLRQPFSLWSEMEEKFKIKSKDFQKICQILAVAECYNFERRAEILKGRHPLSMQVDLQTGVANGVLVARSPEDCAELLFRILTNRMKFTIKHKEFKTEDDSRRYGYTLLEEKVSGCAYRVVTDYEKLTNSFWNYYML